MVWNPFPSVVTMGEEGVTVWRCTMKIIPLALIGALRWRHVVGMLLPLMMAAVLVGGCTHQDRTTDEAVVPATPEQAADSARWQHKAEQRGISPTQKTACEQLAKLPTMASYITEWPDLDFHTGDDPMLVLYRLGFEVVPTLVEALDDQTMTTCTTADYHGGESTRWRVNELAAYLIVRITERNFLIDIGPNTDSDGQYASGLLCYPDSCSNRRSGAIPKFQTVVSNWYAQNAKRSPVRAKNSGFGRQLR